MPAPWSNGDAVQVKLNDSWFNATVDAKLSDQKYRVLFDEPYPTLADAGMTHPRVPDSTPFKQPLIVNASGNKLGAKTVRDPI